MFEQDWKEQLETHWTAKLEASLDLDQAQKVHLIAVGKGSGEIHRFLLIGSDRPSPTIVVKRVISDLASWKLSKWDPRHTEVLAIEWVG